MPDEINYYGLVNKPPIDEICNIDLVNKPDIMSDELLHFGIKGMKWGVRRYQNPDGSLTEAGKKRAKKQEERAAKKRAKKHEHIMRDRKAFMENYYDLSEDDRRKADRYFDALEKMEKREMTHLSLRDKRNWIKRGAITIASLAAITVSAGKIIQFVQGKNGQAVLSFINKI